MSKKKKIVQHSYYNSHITFHVPGEDLVPKQANEMEAIEEVAARSEPGQF